MLSVPQKLLYHAADRKILGPRLASDRVYPLEFLPCGSASIPPELVKTTSTEVFETASYRITLAQIV